MKMYLQGLGYRNPKKDIEQIIWYFVQMASTKKGAQLTRYWNDLREKYYDSLLQVQAYEVLDLICKHSSEANLIRRKKNYEAAKAKAILEIENMSVWSNQYNLRRRLISKISLN